MNWKAFFLGAGVGLFGGLAAKELLAQKQNVSPEKVLENVKSIFKKDGPISGSWILMNPEDYQKQMLDYRVYKGGISRTDNGKTQQFEFIADASTGTVLEIFPIT